MHAEPGQENPDPANLKARLRTEIDNVARHKALQVLALGHLQRMQHAWHPFLFVVSIKAPKCNQNTPHARGGLLLSKGYEIPRDLVVELTPFSKENNLITDSSKPARGAMKRK